MKKHSGMRPHDPAVLLKLITCEDGLRIVTLTMLAHELGISQGEISESLNRSLATGLVAEDKRTVNRETLCELLCFGLKYVFPPSLQPLYPALVSACKKDDRLAKMLDLLNTIRINHGMEGSVAKQLLRRELIKREHPSLLIPPLKGWGMKGKLIPWILKIAPKTEGRWIEPFLGTGAVALNCGYKNAILSDVNPHIINFYKSIQQKKLNADDVRKYLLREGKLLSKVSGDGTEHFLKVKERFRAGSSSLDFLFLTRIGFFGLMRYNKKGEWVLSYNKKPGAFTPGVIEKIAGQTNKVSSLLAGKKNWRFCNHSYEEIIPLANPGDVIYCDPPYLGRYTGYYGGWTERQEERLFDLLSATKAKFILSTWHHKHNIHNKMLKKYWHKFNIITTDHFNYVSRKINNGTPIVEALVCNYDF